MTDPPTLSNDPRWDQLGHLLVTYSTNVQPGERVMIAMGEIDSHALTLAVYRAVIDAGGYPQIQFLSESARDYVLRHGSPDHVSWVPEIEAHGMEWADVYIALRGGFDMRLHDGIDDERMALGQVAQGTISTMRWQQTRWVLVRVPAPALAAEAAMDFDSYLTMFFDACLLDWPALSRAQEHWCHELERHAHIRITGTETDLEFSVAGRKWISSVGQINMPDGECYTAPITGSENGTIYFENPAVLGGRLFDDLRLTWEDGVLKKATSSTNQEFLDKILASPGARQIGEFAIGTNQGIDRFSHDILLDEKIAGTCHIALGRAYPDCGGTNESAIHWDIVKDVRAVGAVSADGVEVLSKGRILIPAPAPAQGEDEPDGS